MTTYHFKEHAMEVYREVTGDLVVRVYDNHNVEVMEIVDGQMVVIDPELWNDSLIDYAQDIYETAKTLGYLK